MMQEFTQEIKNRVLDMLRDVHTAIPGKVVAFDPGRCEAGVLPYGKFKKPDGSMMDYPQLNGVPVYIIQGNGQAATVAYPIKPGDECIVLFSEQALDTWRTNAASDTDLKFDLSSALAIVGMFSRPNPLMRDACDSDAVIIASGGSKISVSPVGMVLTGSVLINGDVTVNGDVTASGVSLKTHTHGGVMGGGGSTSPPN